MTGNKLVLKDGTEYENGTASKSSTGRLMVQIPGNKIAEAAVNFSNPEKTETMICYHSIYKTTYHGYTEMYTVQYFADGDYTEMWLKGENTSEETEHTVPEEYIPAGM